MKPELAVVADYAEEVGLPLVAAALRTGDAWAERQWRADESLSLDDIEQRARELGYNVTWSWKHQKRSLYVYLPPATSPDSGRLWRSHFAFLAFDSVTSWVATILDCSNSAELVSSACRLATAARLLTEKRQ